MAGDDVGIYVHVPFCERICPYCDFAVVARRKVSADEEARLVAALCQELVARRPAYAGRSLDTIYFGGGTPSLLRPDAIAELIQACREAFPGREPAEITLEVNPSTVERERIPDFVAAGVDRFSIGIQSFDDVALRRLGRAHRGSEGTAMVEAVRRAGARTFSLDLILGVAGQARADVMRDVERAIELSPDHVSAYGLTVEEGTPLARGVSRGQILLPGDDLVASMMTDVSARLEQAGLLRYETSSYARPGREARHNRRYWRREPVLGLGVGAHSSHAPDASSPHGGRSANERDLTSWLERIEAGRGAEPPTWERLELEAARGEAAFLALRTREGLAGADFEAEFGASPEACWPVLQDFVRSGWMIHREGRWQLTTAGWLVSDSLFEHFV